MNWLLKIVEGPVKGAEIALIDGMRLKVGSADSSDIVIADTTLPAEAFELDVASEAVTFIARDGSVSELVPFEIKSIGTTSFAIGPQEGDWKALVKPVEKVEEVKSAPKIEKEAENVVSELTAEPETAEDEEPKKGHGVLIAVFAAVLVVIALIAALFILRPAFALPVIEGVELQYSSLRGSVLGWFGKSEAPLEAPLTEEEKLAKLAREYSLELVKDEEGQMTIVGNLKRRTERKAIHALAIAIDANIKFDLTDDETLRDSSNELLFALTGGKLKATEAHDRVVTIEGFAETSDELMKYLIQLNTDVKGISKVNTESVRLGLKTRDIPLVPTHADLVVEKATPKLPAKSNRREAKGSRKYPVAGILMKPYPCVVLKSGLRLVEGSQIQSAKIVRIEPDKIVLQEGKYIIDWRP